MENKENLIESLLERAEKYGKTRIDLWKLKFTDKLSTTVSSVLSHVLFLVLGIAVIVSLSISCALWIGELTGKIYYGFLAVAGFYAFVLLVAFLFRKQIKQSFKNSVIHHLHN